MTPSRTFTCEQCPTAPVLATREDALAHLVSAHRLFVRPEINPFHTARRDTIQTTVEYEFDTSLALPSADYWWTFSTPTGSVRLKEHRTYGQLRSTDA